LNRPSSSRVLSAAGSTGAWRMSAPSCWRMSEEDVQQHLRSIRYRNVLLVVEMAVEPPEIRFDVIAHSDGVERIEQARVQTR